MSRVAVFIDYQNAYHGARRAFGDPRSDPPSFGHIDPGALARLLVGLGHIVDPDRELGATNVYRGEPGLRSHLKLRAAFARQTRRWRADPSLTVKMTALRYRRVEHPGGRTWRAEEKGIDVLLAVDVVRGAYLDEFDTAVVASADTDLLPALEEALRAGKRVETASWSGPDTGFTGSTRTRLPHLEPSPRSRPLRNRSGHHRLPGQVIESGRGAGGRVGAAGPRWDRLHLGGRRAPLPQAGPARPGGLRRRPPPPGPTGRHPSGPPGHGSQHLARPVSLLGADESALWAQPLLSAMLSGWG